MLLAYLAKLKLAFKQAKPRPYIPPRTTPYPFYTRVCARRCHFQRALKLRSKSLSRKLL